MTATASPEKERYLAAFARFAKEAPEDGGAWLRPLRRQAIDAFAARGFPTTKEEAWRHTSVAPITRVPFRLAGGDGCEGITPEGLERLTFEPWACSHLVFVNGRAVPELSRLRPLPAGATVKALAAAIREDRALVEPHLARLADPAAHPFVALNTAFLQDGAFVHLRPGVALDEEIHILHVSTPCAEPAVAHPRALVVAGAGSRATVVQSFVGPGSDPYLTNAVTEIDAGPGAVVDHCLLQRESAPAFHVGTVQARLDRDACLTAHTVTLGGALVRNDLTVVLAGEGSDCTLNGLYVAAGRQHVDNHTLIDHARPHGTSRELYKGVLDEQARGVFDGTIIVRKDAQKTDAWQTNKNLLLSDEALVDTNPRLQILADDVKCKHGATIGQLDEAALFYLRSRAIGVEAARSMLIHAFVNDLLDRVKVAPLRAGLECLLATRLPQRLAARERA